MRPLSRSVTHLSAFRRRTLYVVKYVCVCQPWSKGTLCFFVKSAQTFDSVGASGSCQSLMPSPQCTTPLRARSGSVSPDSRIGCGFRNPLGCEPKAISYKYQNPGVLWYG